MSDDDSSNLFIDVATLYQCFSIISILKVNKYSCPKTADTYEGSSKNM